MNNELTDCKAKFLKFVGKEKQQQKDMALVVESEKTMKGKYLIKIYPLFLLDIIPKII